MKIDIRLIVLVVALLGGTLITGCTDSVVSYDDVDGVEQRYDGPKFRHANLMERALKSSVAGKSSSASQ